MHSPGSVPTSAVATGLGPVVAKGVSEKLWTRIVASNARLASFVAGEPIGG